MIFTIKIISSTLMISSSFKSPALISEFWGASPNIILTNKTGSLGKVTTSIAKNNGNISNIHFTTRKKDFYEIVIDIEVRDSNHLNNIIAALRLFSEVSSLERVKG